MQGATEHVILVGARWHRNDRNVLMFTRDKAKIQIIIMAIMHHLICQKGRKQPRVLSSRFN